MASEGKIIYFEQAEIGAVVKWRGELWRVDYDGDRRGCTQNGTDFKYPSTRTTVTLIKHRPVTEFVYTERAREKLDAMQKKLNQSKLN